MSSRWAAGDETHSTRFLFLLLMFEYGPKTKQLVWVPCDPVFLPRVTMVPALRFLTAFRKRSNELTLAFEDMINNRDTTYPMSCLFLFLFICTKLLKSLLWNHYLLITDQRCTHFTRVSFQNVGKENNHHL